MSVISFFVITIAACFNALANFLAKVGTNKLSGGGSVIQTIPALVLSPYIIGAVACFGLGFFIYTYALMRTHLSVAYPIVVSLTFVMLTIISALYFKEQITPWQIVGISVILCGVWITVLVK